MFDRKKLCKTYLVTNFCFQNDESVLEGAQAEDTDAEFILHILENDIVTGTGGLAQLSSMIHKICEQSHIYQDVYLQSSAIVALLR